MRFRSILDGSGWRTASSRVATVATRGSVVGAIVAVVSAGSGCGSDDCGGFVSINASPERCAEIAEELGCGSFEVTGPTCGLVACARCEGD
jgi:hypothetical protein